ncbi:MAG: lysophospholipid acyltransferase family protein [Salibacteraceae bacterium]|jgi:Kdo2-lipid IVA lauroyltransferase/acyltransferase|nr:lysophospholipid acyltransferase family protein [Salibacteraceae bacterium]
MIGYFFYYVLILPISWLPFKALYALSDGLYFLVYRIFKYRKNVVNSNLKRSFPTYSENKIQEIEEGFYRHLCDVIVEALKGFTISEKDVAERMQIINPEVVDSFFEQGKSVVMVGGHYNNWELFALAIDARIKHQAVALYTNLQNKVMDQKVRSSRSKYGLRMLSIHQIREALAQKQDELTATIFGSDQSPSKKQRAYWMTFLNQETATQFGAEKFAKEYDMPVVFGLIHKVKRGFYEVHCQLITAKPNETPLGYITQMHTQLLEKAIIDKPQFWLWSHKRWKRTRGADDVLNERILFDETVAKH